MLTHGVADTNVPVGESDAFFIALKLLGKDVEYLQIEGEDHWILSHDKRMVWSSSGPDLCRRVQACAQRSKGHQDTSWVLEVSLFLSAWA